MNKMITTVAAATLALGVGATTSNATGLDVTTIGVGYTNPGTSILNAVSGGVFVDGENFGNFFEATAPDFFLDSFPSDWTDASLDYIGIPVILDSSNSTIYASVMSEVAQFFFDLGTTGYLATVDVSNQGLDFNDPDAFIDTDASISLVKYDVAPIPLPAGVFLLLGGLGSLVLLRRKTSA